MEVGPVVELPTLTVLLDLAVEVLQVGGRGAWVERLVLAPAAEWPTTTTVASVKGAGVGTVGLDSCGARAGRGSNASDGVQLHGNECRETSVGCWVGESLKSREDPPAFVVRGSERTVCEGARTKVRQTLPGTDDRDGRGDSA